MESQVSVPLVERLRRLTEGDPSAMAWLYDTLAPTLYKRLRHRYGYPGGLDAEELLQDSFLYFFKRDAQVIRRFLETVPSEERTEEELLRYLWNLSCGVASNRLRTHRRRQAEVQLFDDWDPPSSVDNHQLAADRDQLRRLADCIQGQGERLLLYYRMRFLDGLTPKEITRATGWTQRVTYRVRQHLNEAVSHCADALGIVRG